MPKYRVPFFRVASVGWPISGWVFVGEAYFLVVFSRVALCLNDIFPGGFFPGGFFPDGIFSGGFFAQTHKSIVHADISLHGLV